MPVTLLLWSGSNWISAFCFFEKGILFERMISVLCMNLLSPSQSNCESSLANISNSCPERHLGTDSEPSLSSCVLQLCFCPQLTVLSLTLHQDHWYPCVLGSPAGTEHWWAAAKGLSFGISVGFSMGSFLCVVSLESCTGKSFSTKLTPSYFKYI